MNNKYETSQYYRYKFNKKEDNGVNFNNMVEFVNNINSLISECHYDDSLFFDIYDIDSDNSYMTYYNFAGYVQPNEVPMYIYRILDNLDNTYPVSELFVYLTVFNDEWACAVHSYTNPEYQNRKHNQILKAIFVLSLKYIIVGNDSIKYLGSVASKLATEYVWEEKFKLHRQEDNVNRVNIFDSGLRKIIDGLDPQQLFYPLKQKNREIKDNMLFLYDPVKDKKRKNDELLFYTPKKIKKKKLFLNSQQNKIRLDAKDIFVNKLKTNGFLLNDNLLENNPNNYFTTRQYEIDLFDQINNFHKLGIEYDIDWIDTDLNPSGLTHVGVNDDKLRKRSYNLLKKMLTEIVGNCSNDKINMLYSFDNGYYKKQYTKYMINNN